MREMPVRRRQQAVERGRLAWTVLLFAGLLLTAAGRLGWMQVLGRQHYLNPQDVTYTRSYELPAGKGELHDRRGRPLARSIESASVAANPHLVRQPERLAAQLEPLLGVPRDELAARLTRRWRRVMLRRGVSQAIEQALAPLVARGVVKIENASTESLFTLFVFPRQFQASPDERVRLAAILGRRPSDLEAVQGSPAECLPLATGLDGASAERIDRLGLTGLLVQQDARQPTRVAYLEPRDASIIVEPYPVERTGVREVAWTARLRDEVWQALEPLWADVGAPSKEAVESRLRCRFVYLARELPLEQGAEVERLIARHRLESVFVLREYTRAYPQGDTGRELLGRTDVDERGISGLEAMYNQVVTGVAGSRKVTISARGVPIQQEGEERIEPVHGKHVELTIDAVIQGYAEEAVRGAVTEFDADWGLAVVIDPYRGEVLALVDIANATHDAEYENRPMTLAFEPGSIIKPIVVAGAIDQSVVSARDVFACNSVYQVGRHSLHCIDRHGPETVAEAVRDSCNIALIQVAQRMGQQRLDRTFTTFGLLGRTGLGLPAHEAAGSIFTNDPAGLWSPSKIATVSYGKGIQVSAVGLARAYAAVANGGVLPTLHLERRILDRDGQVIVERLPRSGPRILSAATAAEVRQMLHDVVHDREGTGRAAASELYEVAGKTGTSIAYATQTQRVVSFAGFAPYDQPRLVCLVSVGEPRVGRRWGGTTCGAAFRDIIDRSLQYLGVPPTGMGVAER